MHNQHDLDVRYRDCAGCPQEWGNTLDSAKLRSSSLRVTGCTTNKMMDYNTEH